MRQDVDVALVPLVVGVHRHHLDDAGAEAGKQRDLAAMRQRAGREGGFRHPHDGVAVHLGEHGIAITLLGQGDDAGQLIQRRGSSLPKSGHQYRDGRPGEDTLSHGARPASALRRGSPGDGKRQGARRAGEGQADDKATLWVVRSRQHS